MNRRMWFIVITVALATAGGAPSTGTMRSEERVPIAEERLHIAADLKNWVLASRSDQPINNGIFWTKEYIPAGQSAGHWKELVGFGYAPQPASGPLPLFGFARAVLDRIEESCPTGFEGNVVHYEPGMVVYEWRYRGCRSGEPLTFDQHELAVVVPGAAGLHWVRYAVRGQMTDAVRQRWLMLLMGVELTR